VPPGSFDVLINYSKRNYCARWVVAEYLVCASPKIVSEYFGVVVEKDNDVTSAVFDTKVSSSRNPKIAASRNNPFIARSLRSR